MIIDVKLVDDDSVRRWALSYSQASLVVEGAQDAPPRGKWNADRKVPFEMSARVCLRPSSLSLGARSIP